MTAPKPDPDDEGLAAALRASRVLVDAPEALIQRAVGLFDGAARPATRPLRPRLLATLQFDSAMAPPLAFGRRAGAAEMRQLLYALEGCDVDLRIAPADDGGDRYTLSGQLLGPDAQGSVVAEPAGAVGEAAPPPLRAMLSELGEFRLSPLAAGSWRLTLELSDKVLELPPLELAPAAGLRP